MPKIFGIIAAVVLAVSAYIAMKNQQAYKKEIQSLHSEQAEKVSTTQELEAQQKRLKDAEQAKENFASRLVETGKKLNTAIKLHDEIEEEVKQLQEAHSAKEEQVARAKETLAGLPSADDLIPKLKRLKNQLVESQDGIASEDVRLKGLRQREQDGKAKIAALEQMISGQTSGVSMASLKTSISGIYEGWGFVILAGGDNEGVVPGSTLDVLRDGEVIAKLRVTAVEAGRSAADIIMDTVAAGVRLSVGDVVVAETRTDQPSSAVGYTKF
ncbi:MAG: hypothetical protein ACPH2J_02670 [Akkermansiaceae bacterium]